MVHEKLPIPEYRLLPIDLQKSLYSGNFFSNPAKRILSFYSTLTISPDTAFTQILDAAPFVVNASDNSSFSNHTDNGV